MARIHRQAEADDGRPQHPAQARPAPRPHAPLALPFAHEPLRGDDPRQVGRYRLTARLGEGGMGTVYLGLSPGARQVAVKVVREELVSDPSFRRRFAREVDAARRVSGFHTAPVVDAGPADTRPWLVTEYIPGPSLDEVLGIHGPLPALTLRALALGVAEALEAIHACGIVHRDLKPGNILVSAAGPRVIDFGIARGAEATALTDADIVVGTRGFLAPEQLTGAPLSAAVDMYAFGTVLCHAGGAARYAEGTALAVAPRLLPADLASVAAACLDHDPAGRPSPTEVLRSLGGAETEPPSNWLPPALRTLVDLHQAATVTAAPPE
ncbi:serine/threonine-protein kinase [Streptomyces narbonensis]|uniref:Serine/threonine-protein kinase n=1 Tax=Streptomyces narbonensis TaxID=67333 RepID=A0ABV3CHS1_9ACTN